MENTDYDVQAMERSVETCFHVGKWKSTVFNIGKFVDVSVILKFLEIIYMRLVLSTNSSWFSFEMVQVRLIRNRKRIQMFVAMVLREHVV